MAYIQQYKYMLVNAKKHSFLFFLFLATLQHETLKNTVRNTAMNTVNGDILFKSYFRYIRD